MPTEDELVAWVARELAALDEHRPERDWRHQARGMTTAEAIATAPRSSRLDIAVTIGEVRVLRQCALDRGITLRSWMRRAVGTAAVACDHVDPAAIPSLTRAGLLVPR